jgi:hypothetical protein
MHQIMIAEMGATALSQLGGQGDKKRMPWGQLLRKKEMTQI